MNEKVNTINANSNGIEMCAFVFIEMQKVQNIIGELLDSSEPLIHDTYGCGSQGLINLMLTGQAVPHVWDFDQDVGGLSKCCLHRR